MTNYVSGDDWNRHTLRIQGTSFFLDGIWWFVDDEHSAFHCFFVCFFSFGRGHATLELAVLVGRSVHPSHFLFSKFVVAHHPRLRGIVYGLVLFQFIFFFTLLHTENKSSNWYCIEVWHKKAWSCATWFLFVSKLYSIVSFSVDFQFNLDCYCLSIHLSL